jgi:cystathionine beta-lyase
MNFNEQLDRNEYPTMKWSRAFLAEHFGNEEAIPMSVADMDLKAPPSVIEQLQKRVAHGIFGYEYQPENYFGHGIRIGMDGKSTSNILSLAHLS